MPKTANEVPHVPRKRAKFPEDAQNPENMPEIPGNMPELSPKVMLAYSA